MTPVNTDQIKQGINIVDVISQHVNLRKAGKDHIGLCPFHTEKTPSFTVSESKQFFYCFGCGAGGDVLDFVMKTNGLDFLHALKFFGVDVDVAVPETQVRRQKQRRRQEQRKRERDQKAYQEYNRWVTRYANWLKDIILTCDLLLDTLPTAQIFEIGNVFNRLSIWKYHQQIIDSGDEDVIFQLYTDQSSRIFAR